MSLELYYMLKRKTDEGKTYRDDWNSFTIDWSSGYRKAMWEKDEMLNFYMSNYVKSAVTLKNSLYFYGNDQHGIERRYCVE